MALQNRNRTSVAGGLLGLTSAVVAALAMPSPARADRYDCSAKAMYKFTEGVMEKVSDGGRAHQNFLVDTAKGFVRVGNIANMVELKFENAVVTRKNGGWVGIMRDGAGRYRGALEIRDELAFGFGDRREQYSYFIWSGMIIADSKYMLSGVCTFRGN